MFVVFFFELIATCVGTVNEGVADSAAWFVRCGGDFNRNRNNKVHVRCLRQRETHSKLRTPAPPRTSVFVHRYHYQTTGCSHRDGRLRQRRRRLEASGDDLPLELPFAKAELDTWLGLVLRMESNAWDDRPSGLLKNGVLQGGMGSDA